MTPLVLRGLVLGLFGVIWATGNAVAQDCLGALTGSRHHAVAVRLEPLAGAQRDEWLLGGEYVHVWRRLALGAHGGAVYQELIPPGEVAPAIGGSAAFLVGGQSFCPAVSMTAWSPDVESFAATPGDSDLSLLLLRIGLGLAKASGDSVRLAVWLYPHVSLARTHSTFGDMEGTDWESETLADIGAGVAGGRFWGSAALRFQFADDPGEDIPFGAALMARAGVRF